MIVCFDSARKSRLIEEIDRLLSAIEVGSMVVGGKIIGNYYNHEARLFELLDEAEGLGIDINKELKFDRL